jgi:hypothetical protein
MTVDGPELHVLAAAFPDVPHAEAAEAELRAQLDVEPPDISIGPAGGDPKREGMLVMLAGRFREHRIRFVEMVIARHSGTVLDRQPESRIRPRLRRSV